MELFNLFLLFYCGSAIVLFLIFYVKDLLDRKNKFNKLDVIFNLTKSLPIDENADAIVDKMVAKRISGAKYRKVGN